MFTDPGSRFSLTPLAAGWARLTRRTVTVTVRLRVGCDTKSSRSGYIVTVRPAKALPPGQLECQREVDWK